MRIFVLALVVGCGSGSEPITNPEDRPCDDFKGPNYVWSAPEEHCVYAVTDDELHPDPFDPMGQRRPNIMAAYCMPECEGCEPPCDGQSVGTWSAEDGNPGHWETRAHWWDGDPGLLGVALRVEYDFNTCRWRRCSYTRPNR